MWSALENIAFRESLPMPLCAGDSICGVLVSGQINRGRFNLQYLGRRRCKPYLLKQFYCLNTNAFLRWQNEARFIELPQIDGYIWPCDEWRGGVIAPWPEGVPLYAWLRAKPRNLPARIGVGLGLARCMARLHDAGIIHRNLSSSCVWISEKNIQISDFGAACHERWDDFWNDSMPPCGSPAYASPEALHGKKSGPAKDMYALGGLLYLLLADRPPFNRLKLLIRKRIPWDILPDTLPPVREVPPSLYDGITACMAGNPANRPTAHEVASILAEYGEWDDQDTQIVLPPLRFNNRHRQRIMVFIKGDERAASLFDAAIEQALAEPSLFLFVGLVPGNLPSGHLERFKGSLYRKLAQGLIRCRRHHLIWSLRLLETIVPEYTALKLIRQYRPMQVFLGKATSRPGSVFCRCLKRQTARENIGITHII
ncbi:protein kinase domain-containing protein [Desulfoplanes formicivorans]|uniref:Protein kinase domain-containing protein n=1 Tax=Desulfoplanes formicivorans TaxID=1592317 RepID=A0A194AFY7_9BACT|nr:protein kinase [Desulfoplanes formicivorans]GAU07996.1 hypothetical protein DPF_0695 [Desulfoplanes formicivorans]